MDGVVAGPGVVVLRLEDVLPDVDGELLALLLGKRDEPED